ncbi:hypothetical protein E1B28_007223 [Marasmius oreades]|uniref:Dystroglycan-type cadherin-like domain-containing protein n=1 Tax=Marasmius oreades TaxID=181124 RepID=A0A9P7S2X5_9AGAR|nr:uncharacterized protein E1B28_007223 [Marasmius oreades]KAG7093553.1 hypothetical protein E1B28_007223 [Marasmius oreades]
MFSPLLFCFLVFGSTFTFARVIASIPLDNQLPGIARVGQYYNWTFSPNTFTSTSSIFRYTASPLVEWLSFDPTTLSLYGTPTDKDKGFPDVTITAYDSDSSASSWCNIYVTDAPPPALNITLEKQFHAGNPSLSSVFIPSSESTFARFGEPTLRIPFGWSFSIGFDSLTFTNEYQNVRYAVLQRDGSPLPGWMKFSMTSITIDGVAPREHDFGFPRTIHLSLHATDRSGYTATTIPFTVVVADHELCMVGDSLPTINITAGDSFSFQLNSFADFTGVKLDGKDLSPEDITSVNIDVSGSEWLRYDPTNRTLSGEASIYSTALPLPVVVTAFSQTITTTIPIAIVPSFFNSADLGTLNVAKNGKVLFDIRDHLSNATEGKAILSVIFDLPEVENYLHLDDEILSGTLPGDFPASDISATFTAYSMTTHSTSHALLQMTYPSNSGYPHPPSLSSAISATHKKLILALSITFGIVGGICGLACCMAVCRHYARVKDNALEGEEGQRNWSERDKQWYGNQGEKIGYGWTESANPDNIQRMGLDLSRSPQSPRSPPNYGNIGLGLRRVMERSQSDVDQANTEGKVHSPGVISKREFMSKVRDTVRNVSDRYARVKRPHGGRSQGITITNIGKPILLHRTQSSSLRNGSSPSTSNPSKTPTDNVTTPATVHFAPRLSRHGSSDSTSSLESIEAHANEAVVQAAQTASRAPSFSQQTPPARPRLVPFTSATRVHVLQTLASSPESSTVSSIGSTRVTSQTAATNMWKEAADAPTQAITQSGSGDELSEGMHFVRALGADQAPEAHPSTLTVSTNFRSSFSSLDSSTHGHGSEGKVVRMIVRVGEQFKFHVPLVGERKESRGLEAKLMSGKRLPAFLRVDYGNGTNNVEFYGLPGVKDFGDLDIRVCVKGDREGTCLARVLLQIVRRS